MEETQSLPQAFTDSFAADYGQDECERLKQALQQPPQASIRLNSDKIAAVATGTEPGTSATDSAEDRAKSKSKPRPVPWNANGRYIDLRPTFTADPALPAGAYYVQEAASMFLGYAFAQCREAIGPDPTVLDLCAAPGGKATLLAQELRGRGLLVCNEYVPSRVAPLRENLSKWGAANTIVCNAAPQDFAILGETFDAIAVDAPCSGEGMFRKDPRAVAEWSQENVAMCAARQRDILASIVPTLKEGGILFYSTCTYNHAENEDNIDWLCHECGLEEVVLPVPSEWGICPGRHGYHFLPSHTLGEGLYLAVMQKTGKTPAGTEIASCTTRQRATARQDKRQTKAKPDTVPQELAQWVKDPAGQTFARNGKGLWTAIGTQAAQKAVPIVRAVKVVQYGTVVATEKGSDLLPTTPLALSAMLNPEAFESYNADWQTAMAYLRKEAIDTPGKSKGMVLVRYNNMPLGFVKNLGTRANNLYPAEWHIKTPYTIDDYTNLLEG